MKKAVLVLMTIILFNQIVYSQDVKDHLNDIISNESESYLKSYLQPFSTALSTAMGSALYHRAYTKGFPRVDIGISMAYVIIPEDDKSFTNESGNEAATIFGSTSSGIQDEVTGFDKDTFVMPYLQANIGLVANLEATGRFTSVNVNYLGDITIYGVGLKYDLSDMVPLNLIDLSVQAMYHKFTLGDLMDAGAFSMNLQASVGIPVLPIDIYGGLGFDNSTLEVKTEKLENPIGNVRIDGENSVRFNAGLSYTFLMFNLHADYNIGEYNSIGAGLMVVL